MQGISEEFVHPYGQFELYDAYDVNQYNALRHSRHIDIRSMVQNDLTAPPRVGNVLGETVGSRDGQGVAFLDSVLVQGERWVMTTSGTMATHSVSTVGYQPTVRLTSTSTPQLVAAVSIADPIDISSATGFADDDYISVACPSFPLSSVNTSLSSIDFSIDPTGAFGNPALTKSLPFNTSILAAAQGHTELRWLRSSLAPLPLTAITAVRIRVHFTAIATASFSGVRLIAKDWVHMPSQIDTRYNRLRRTVALNGDPTNVGTLTQPIAWRSALVPGEDDPKLLNGEVAVVFNSGTPGTTSSEVGLYFREVAEDYMTMLDLNGLTMAELNGRPQPDIGQAKWAPRTQSDLSQFTQSELEGKTMFDLERTPDYLSSSWTRFLVQWSSTDTTVSIGNSEGGGYQFNLGSALPPGERFIMFATLEDTSVRCRIYPLTARNEIDTLGILFDSTLIDDDFAYKRRRGRVGWYARFGTGDAYLDSIRFRKATFYEYRTRGFESLTPVEAAQVFTEASPNIELFSDAGATSGAVEVTLDRERTRSDQSYRINHVSRTASEGLITNQFTITDFDQTEVYFDLYMPTSELGSQISLYLIDAIGNYIELPRITVLHDQWQPVRIGFPIAHKAQSGPYQLALLQDAPNASTWWVDNISIYERSVSWYARSVVEDPWNSNQAEWTPLGNTVNQPFGIASFPTRGKTLQVRAYGHRQDSFIGKITTVPKYAELGRIVSGITPPATTPPAASFSTANTGRSYIFTDTSLDPAGQLINWYWTISDGSVHSGPVVNHTFAAAGTYSVVLRVTDNNGASTATNAIISVA